MDFFASCLWLSSNRSLSTTEFYKSIIFPTNSVLSSQLKLERNGSILSLKVRAHGVVGYHARLASGLLTGFVGLFAEK
jgi:tRNA threonylcarbamoyladenosine modification (KEOPS) complex  Pcc1 subunit